MRLLRDGGLYSATINDWRRENNAVIIRLQLSLDGLRNDNSQYFKDHLDLLHIAQNIRAVLDSKRGEEALKL